MIASAMKRSKERSIPIDIDYEDRLVWIGHMLSLVQHISGNKNCLGAILSIKVEFPKSRSPLCLIASSLNGKYNVEIFTGKSQRTTNDLHQQCF